MLRRQNTFTTENTEFTEIFKRVFSVLSVHSVVRLRKVSE